MVKNEGTTDRTVRGIAGALLLILGATQLLSGVLGVIAIVVGIVLLVTAAVGFCPIYRMLGMSTCKR